jgi:hypothetical protein
MPSLSPLWQTLAVRILRSIYTTESDKLECELGGDCETFSIISGTISTWLLHASLSTLANRDQETWQLDNC